MNDKFRNYLELDNSARKIYNSCFTINNKRYFASNSFNKIESILNEKMLLDLIKNDYPEKVIIKNKKEILDLPKNFFSLAFYDNTINSLIEKIDFFQKDILKINKIDKKLYVTKNTYSMIKPKLLNSSEYIKKEIIKDYKKHFNEIEDVISWIIACRFTESRRSSFLHLRVSAGFGKSFLKSIFQDLGILVECRYDDFKSPTSISGDEFENSLLMIIDEFTIFKQEFKDLTNNMIIDSKNQLRKQVDIFAKIFLSAENSNSFVNGVDSQIADRVNVIDKDTTKLENREVWEKYGNKLYYNTILFYIYNRLNKGLQYYINLGEINSSKEAEKILKSFYLKFGLKEENLELKMKKIFYLTIYNLIELDNNTNIMTEKEKEISNHILTNDNDYIYINKVTTVFKLTMENESEDFYKKARFKLNGIDKILEVDEKELNKQHKIKFNSGQYAKPKNIRAFKISKIDFEKIIKEINKEELDENINYNTEDLTDYLD